MSGIYGVWQPFARVVEDEEEIDKLQKWNKAYGSLEERVFVGDTVCVGCSYEKLHENAPKSAPVLKADGKYAVIDAVLYSREEMLQKGQFPNTFSDEELIFAYIERFGCDALKEVNGDFSGAIYDTANRTWTLFRDHMGVRPLFYSVQNDGVVFSTDIRGLVALRRVDVSVDEAWLWNRNAGFVSNGTERTEFAHIFCVKPASYLTFSLKDTEIQSEKKSYWKVGSRKIRLSSEAEYIAKLRELVTDSVKRRLGAVSGLVGAELSGGLDSSIIDILIHRLGREAVYFSWSASPEEVPYSEQDERLIVEDICKQENISCHYNEKVLRIEKDSVMSEKMRAIGIEPDMNAGLFRRYVLPPYINTLHICKSSQYVNRCGAKVIFTGHGGDEGVSHRCNPYELFYYKEYWHYLQYMWESTQGGRHRFYNTLLRCKKNLTTSRKALTSPHVSIMTADRLLKKEYCEKYRSEKGAPVTFAYDPRSYIRGGGSRNRLDIVALLGAYCGVRYMIPYLDYRVVDYAVSIPRHMYLKKQRNRYIFREAFKDIMPESLYELRGKEDTSWRNVEKEEQDATEYLERKKRLCAMLDREYWKEYLDWEYLAQWADTPLADADEANDFATFVGIDNCLSLQNLITFSRAIGAER